MNTRNHQSDRLFRDNSHQIPGRNTKTWVLVVSMLLISGVILGCGLLSGLQNSEADDPSILLTQADQAFQNTIEMLSIFATQTAIAEELNVPSVTPSPSHTFTPIPPSPTNTPPTLSPTPSITPITATPTKTSIAPPNTPTVAATKISFRTGGTSAYLQKTIESGKTQIFTVRAVAGQTMILTASSAGADVYFTAKGFDDGVWLFDPSSPASSWTGSLPKTQRYQVNLMTDNPSTTYFLSVEIPANILFATGAYSDTVSGYVDVDAQFHPGVLTRVRYLARASAGQTMTVTLSSPNINDLSLGIIGQGDGQVYLDYQVKNNGVEFVLPTTQGYYLDVYAVNGVSTEFVLELTIK